MSEEQEKKPVFVDIADHAEDCRIRTIGETCVANPGKKIGFVTDDEPGKADRYIAKLQEFFPGVKTEKCPSPVPRTILIRCVYSV